MPQLSISISEGDLARLDAFAEKQSETDIGSANRSRAIRGLIRTHLPDVDVPVIRERRRRSAGE
jgi:metal-responsive CopG/Arc/MetJ family transcriptional regulator